MVIYTAFSFYMCTPCGKTFSLVLRSRSSVKVEIKYQGHIKKKKKWLLGGVCVFCTHTHLVSTFLSICEFSKFLYKQIAKFIECVCDLTINDTYNYGEK